MWYRFEECNPIGIPRIKEYQVAFYNMHNNGYCFDEDFYSPDEIDKVIPYVETEEDVGNYDRTKVFVHFDDGDVYELKLKKIDKDKSRGYFYDDNYENEYYEDYYEDPCEDENMKFIWGVKSWDNLSSSDACLYTMNDIDLIYLKDEDKYILGIETIYWFKTEEDKINYLRGCLKAFTEFMTENGYDTEKKPSWWNVFGDGINTHFDSIEDCYAMFKLLVNGYCN